jgi:hypothetical protein
VSVEKKKTMDLRNVVVSVHKDERCTTGRWHKEKSAVSENIVPKSA